MRLRAEHERPALPWWGHLAMVLVGWALVALAHVPLFW